VNSIQFFFMVFLFFFQDSVFVFEQYIIEGCGYETGVKADGCFRFVEKNGGLGIYLSGKLCYKSTMLSQDGEIRISEEKASSIDVYLPFYVSGDPKTRRDRIKNVWLKERAMQYLLDSGFDFFC